MAAAAAVPRLVTMVPPEFPPRILDQIGPLGEVTVELTLRRDGRVVGVNVLPPAPRPAIRYLVDALQQWRYDPLPTEQTLRVQLVFNETPR